ncbi:GLPGLI family protein [Chitinophaga terrae (ex Kim and Jung 2007)]|uniref:GLPGLI family protein n=2 Tax=Chitinophaga terrae (ex Kim and Jung 2007) TaxID=408074 RepID=A0A1H4A863_9BACT|nr:GLPGLI family protein [Chitinophaga terrae (ex Kim and Jung 2007)]
MGVVLFRILLIYHHTMSYRIYLFCYLLFLTTSAWAQRVVSDAKIVYKMVLPPEQLQLDQMLEGSSLTQYMKGAYSRIDINFNIVNYTYLINHKEETITTLIDQHGNKYMVKTDRQQYLKDMQQYEGIKFTDQPETKEIAGYKCRRAIGLMPDGKTFEVYYTPDLVPENKQYNRRFMNLGGMPLEFEILTKTGEKMRVIASRVELNPIPASYFDVPKKGYKVVSQQELQNM